jgi:ABC-type multidrug transport system ATPase subunit
MTDSVVAKIEHVSHRYRTSVALDDVTIDIPAGRMIGVIGPDGVGKSTLLALIGGVRIIQQGLSRSLMVIWPTKRSASHRVGVSPTCRRASAAISTPR